MKLFYLLARLLIALTIGAILLVGYWLTFPVNPITLHDDPIVVVTKELRRGETIVIHSNFCKSTDSEAHIQAYVVGDDRVYPVPERFAYSPAGCYDEHRGNVDVPFDIPLGTYKLKLTVTYYLNPIRVETYDFYTEEFSVIE